MLQYIRSCAYDSPLLLKWMFAIPFQLDACTYSVTCVVCTGNFIVLLVNRYGVPVPQLKSRTETQI
jgi:hypothetical protein